MRTCVWSLRSSTLRPGSCVMRLPVALFTGVRGAGQSQRHGKRIGSGGGALQQQPEPLSVNGPYGHFVTVAAPGVESRQSLDVAVVFGGNPGVEGDHRAQIQAPSGEQDGELVAPQLQGMRCAAEQGAHGGGVLAAEGDTRPGQERGDHAVPFDEQTRDTQNDPFVRGELVGDGEVLLAVALHHLQVLDVELQLRGLPAHCLGLGRHLAAPDGTCARPDFEGAAETAVSGKCPVSHSGSLHFPSSAVPSASRHRSPRGSTSARAATSSTRPGSAPTR
ncbi:hypothetical protein BN159_0038 [Streptomyces davaonensis JCM 4913]|uniref:Uncharacterized protein n=1 Tax=Streptomyces davaonensis (strain DSM 101723 / JCM 4913 / KCC S-0913 / 768) TaxID=1214101 RepID=K4QUA8_STRDJ|nr:hypothetical protein BN159_0038 [Streptomyces davaonensis JCM 4913]